MIAFTVPAIPIAQPRQRHAIRGNYVANYTPTKHPVTAFKATVRLSFADAYQGPPLEGPVTLKIAFIFPRPGRMIWKKRDMPRVEHTSKPDLDNCLKSVKDALKGLAWRDDSQVSQLVACKHIASGDEQPHVYVEIAQ